MLGFSGNTFGFLVGKFKNFTFKVIFFLNYYMILAFIDVWQSYFTHTCCQIHFTQFCRKFTFVAIFSLFLGKIVLAETLLV